MGGTDTSGALRYHHRRHHDEVRRLLLLDPRLPDPRGRRDLRIRPELRQGRPGNRHGRDRVPLHAAGRRKPAHQRRALRRRGRDGDRLDRRRLRSARRRPVRLRLARRLPRSGLDDLRRLRHPALPVRARRLHRDEGAGPSVRDRHRLGLGRSGRPAVLRPEEHGAVPVDPRRRTGRRAARAELPHGPAALQRGRDRLHGHDRLPHGAPRVGAAPGGRRLLP